MSAQDYIYCYQGKALRVAGGTAVIGKKYVPVDPYNPLGLPTFTIRVKLESGASMPSWCGDSRTIVDAQENVWDVTKNDTSWRRLFVLIDDEMGDIEAVQIEDVLGANATGVTSMASMFAYCSSLTSVALFDTSSCANMYTMFMNCDSLTSVPLFNTSSCTAMTGMFYECTSLAAIPLFNTSSCDDMTNMFFDCINVQSGALALYQQASTQDNEPMHIDTFTECGSNTVTGAAELAQIPTYWGGTMA